MRRLLSNHFLLLNLACIGAYWGIGPLLPKPSISNAVSIVAICAGIFLFVQYVEAAVAVLFKQERRPDGSHWAVYGATVAAFGTVYGGGWTLLWNYMGQPDPWVATAASSFGRACVAIGFLMMGISHETVKIGGSYPKGFWRAVLVMFAIVIAFVAGTHFASI